MRASVLAIMLAAACAVWLAAAGCSGLADVDAARFVDPKPDHLTFWGHGCVYIETAGIGIVTDPVFKKSVWFLRRFVGAPPQELIGRTRVVLASHAHPDHLSATTIATFPKDVIVLCPPPVAERLQDAGITARALQPGEQFELRDVQFTAVMANHPGGRFGLRDAADGNALGWVIRTPSATIFYSGDTSYCSSFSHVGWTYAPDIAIINVNVHLGVADAARAAWATRAPVVIPTHWGAYGYWLFGGNRRPRDENELKRLLGDRLRVVEVGASFPIQRVGSGR